jgi:Universal stress protein family
MYKRVLLPLDGSMIAETIIPFLLEIAGPLIWTSRCSESWCRRHPWRSKATATSAPITSKSSAAMPSSISLGPLRSSASKACASRRRFASARPSLTILAGARAVKADLIAMTTHGRGGLGRLLFGSVTEAVLRHAEMPVFVMRQTQAQASARAAWEAVR